MFRAYETSGLIAAIGPVCFGLAVLWSPSAGGLDCTKAATPVERAICADPGLKATDARLSDLYFSVLNRATRLTAITGNEGRHAGLIETQRGFVGKREKDCAAGGPADINAASCGKRRPGSPISTSTDPPSRTRLLASAITISMARR
jgi:uncharacterized protein YecT (DUF1311 family)